MTFQQDKFGREGGDSKLSVQYVYTYPTDNLATITASAYFNSQSNRLRVNDRIFVTASNGAGNYIVTAVSPNVTVTPANDVTDMALSEGAIPLGNSSDIAAELAAGASGTVLQSNGTTASYGLVGTSNITDASVTQAKVDSTMLRFGETYYIDGKATTAVWATNTHPKARLVRAFVELVEAPDSSTTTYTVLIQNATGTVSMTDTLTFTEGTDSAGAIKVFTPVTAGNADEILKADILNIITSGTTTTAGAVKVFLDFVGIA